MHDADHLHSLISSCALKDRSAFSQLYQLTSSNLYAIAMRIVKKPALADDVLQDAYINIWNKAADFSRQKGSVMAWMSSIVRYRAIDLLRRQKTHVDLQQVEHEIEQIDFNTLDKETLLSLKDCLDLLDSEQRNSVLISFYEGLTHPELAARLSRPLGTIKSWIRRSLQQLRQCLEQ